LGWVFDVSTVDASVISVSGSGTSTVTFTTNNSAAFGDVLTASYDAGVGDAVEASTGIALQSFTDLAVNNQVEEFAYPTDGLVARWMFDGDILDSYNSNDLSLVAGSTGYTTGKVTAQAYLTDGTAHHNGNATCTAVFDGTKSWSYSFWIKANTGFSPSAFMRIGDSPRVNNVISTNGKWYFNRFVGSNYLLNFNAGAHTFTENTWHHIVMTYDGATFKGYVNNDINVLDASTVATTANFGTAPFLHLDYDGAASTLDNVALNAVYLYNKALSESEIAQLYNGGDGV